MSFHFDPYSPAVDADPFPYYKHLRDEAPCFWSEEAQMWILSRYADIVSAGQDWQTYSSASGNLMTELPGRAGATLGSSDPPKHDRLRGLIQHAFMKRNLLALEEPIRDVAKQVFGQLTAGDVVYCDPPYVPLSKTASFTSYASQGFTLDDQAQLAILAEQAQQNGCSVLISNHDTTWTRKIYHQAQLQSIAVGRSISQKGQSRGKVQELFALYQAGSNSR